MSTRKKQQPKRTAVAAQSNQEKYGTGKKARVGDILENEKNECKIWLNNKFVVRPNYTTSYGILFYREAGANDAKNENDGSDTDGQQGCPNVIQQIQFQYLLGLIPQGNSWTVFKGLPENDERPEETAIREFEEESSLEFPYNREDWKSCPVRSELYGVTSTKKLLHIFLIPAPPQLAISNFNVDNVVKIDAGRFSGVPEIIEIKYLTKRQAIEGMVGRGKTKAAKIYKSQVSILERADSILNNRNN
jgi:hypothetical protein